MFNDKANSPIQTQFVMSSWLTPITELCDRYGSKMLVSGGTVQNALRPFILHHGAHTYTLYYDKNTIQITNQTHVYDSQTG